MTAAQTDSRTETGARTAQRIAWVVAGAFFMETLDGTIIATALPAIAHSFGIRPLDASLGITIYLVAMAVGVVASGWLAQRLGTRRVFVGALALFSLSSLLCAVAPDFWVFVGARLVQGLAAASMSPVGRLVVLRETPKPRIIEAIALITWPGLIAPVVGPPLGGLIITYVSWHWIFLVNVPLGLLTIGLVFRFFPARAAERSAVPLDAWGLLLASVAVAAVVLGLSFLAEGQVAPVWAESAIVLGVLVGWAAVRHSRRHTHPILDLRPLGYPTFALATASAGMLSRIAINASPFLLPLMFQLGFGWNALRAGSMVLPYMLGNLVIKSVTTPLLRRFGFRRTLIWNGWLNVACLAAIGSIQPSLPVAVIAPLLLIAGMSRSMNFTSINTLAFADVPDAMRAHASALATLLQQVSVVLGVAVGVLVLGFARNLRGAESIALPDFRWAWAAVALIMVVAVMLYRRLPEDAGSALASGPGGPQGAAEKRKAG
jgi:EmrB/QacA subfamily drug resistance transporter